MERAKKKYSLKVIIPLVIFVVVVIAMCLNNFYNVKYKKMDLVSSTGKEEYKNCIYKPLGKGVICVSRGNIAFVDDDGRERWKHSAEFTTPFVETSGNMALCFDREGNKIILESDEGKNVKITAPYPIERGCVSESGSFAVILDNGKAPQVLCYNEKGEEIARHQTSLKNRGYPLAIALDKEGERLLVSYLDVRTGSASSLVTCYSLKGQGEGKNKHISAEKEFPGEIITEVAFIGENKAAVIGTDGGKILALDKKMKKDKSLKIRGEVRKAVIGSENICIVSKENGRSILDVYDMDGKKVFNKKDEEKFEHVRLGKGEVISYSGKMISIMTFSGREKFKGKAPENISEIIGINNRNYILGGDRGVFKVRLSK